jgi:hypothetical protein
MARRITQGKQQQKAGQAHARMETALEIDQPSWGLAPHSGCLQYRLGKLSYPTPIYRNPDALSYSDAGAHSDAGTYSNALSYPDALLYQHGPWCSLEKI